MTNALSIIIWPNAYPAARHAPFVPPFHGRRLPPFAPQALNALTGERLWIRDDVYPVGGSAVVCDAGG